MGESAMHHPTLGRKEGKTGVLCQAHVLDSQNPDNHMAHSVPCGRWAMAKRREGHSAQVGQHMGRTARADKSTGSLTSLITCDDPFLQRKRKKHELFCPKLSAGAGNPKHWAFGVIWHCWGSAWHNIQSKRDTGGGQPNQGKSSYLGN